MRVNHKNRILLTPFSELPIGELFECESKTYMKTNTIEDCGVTINCVCLNYGDFASINTSDKITPLGYILEVWNRNENC